jgi:hypothetical protein
MIDWYRLAANGLWIAGLAVIVAAFSYHDWVARETKRPRRDLFRQRSWQLPWTAGMCLTCAGWGLSQASWWWETVLWLALGGWFAWDLVRLLAAQQPADSSRHGRTQTNTVKR